MSDDVALTYTIALNIAALVLFAMLRLAGRLLSLTARKDPTTSRTGVAGVVATVGRWSGTVVALALTSCLAAFLALLVAAAIAVTAGTADEPLSRGWEQFLLVAGLAVFLGSLAICTHFLLWFRRGARRLEGDAPLWAGWMGPEWNTATRRAVLLGAWEFKLVMLMVVVVVVLDAAPLFYEITRGAADGVSSRDRSSSDTEATSLLPAMALVAMVAAVALLGGVWLRRPYLYLLDQSLSLLATRQGRVRRAGSTTSPRRWRSKYHSGAFEIAGALRRCVPRFRGRLPAAHVDAVATAAARLRDRLRESSVTAHLSQADLDDLRGAVRASVALVCADDVVRVSGQVALALPLEADSDPGLLGGIRLFIDGLSEVIQRYGPALKSIFVFGLVTTFLITGQLERVLELVKS